MALVFVVSTPATAGNVEPQVRLFATCAGRLSALMEHQWMFDGDASELTGVRRAGFVELLDAILPLAIDAGFDGRQILAWRIDAKMAQAQLLQRSVFGKSDREIRHAQKVSDRHLSHCTSLLLG